jgi:hypothetical protein
MITLKQLALLGYRTQQNVAVLSVHFAVITVRLPASQPRDEKDKYRTRFEWKRTKTINTNNCIVMGKIFTIAAVISTAIVKSSGYSKINPLTYTDDHCLVTVGNIPNYICTRDVAPNTKRCRYR